MKNQLIPVFIFGKKYYVPRESTIITAMEHVGFKLKKGVGCREGFCGACASLYRLDADYKLHGGLGCQTVVQPNMQIVQIPFTPVPKVIYNLENIKPDPNVFVAHYPELYRCLSCNTCTKICPQELQVMDFVQAAIRGDFALAANLSFDCIMCGLCGARCPAEIAQFNVALLARRIFGKYLVEKGSWLQNRKDEIASGKFEEGYKELNSSSSDQIMKRYYERKIDFDAT